MDNTIVSDLALVDFKLDDGLIEIFRNEAQSLLIEIKAQITLLNNAGTVGYDLMRVCHTIGSISGTMGFTGLSELASAMERWAIPHVDRHEPILESHLALVNTSSINLQRMLEDIIASKQPGECDLLVAQLHEIAVDVGHSTADAGEEVVIPNDGLISDHLTFNAEPLFSLPPFIDDKKLPVIEKNKEESAHQFLEFELETTETNDGLFDFTDSPLAFNANPSLDFDGDIFNFDAPADESPFSFGDDLPDLSITHTIKPEVIVDLLFDNSEEEDEAQNAILAESIAAQKALVIANQSTILQVDETNPVKDHKMVEDLTLIITIVDAKNDADAAVNDDIDPELLEIFYEECQGLLDEMRDAVKDFHVDITNLNALHALKRALHTIKGGARMGGALKAGALFHVTESMLDDAIANNNLSKENFDLSRDKIGKGALLLSENFSQYVGPSASLNLAGLVSSVTVADNQDAIPIKIKSSLKIVEKNTGTVKIGQKTLDDMLIISGDSSIVRSQISNAIGEIVINTPQLKTSLERLRKLMRDIELQGEIMIYGGDISEASDEQSIDNELIEGHEQPNASVATLPEKVIDSKDFDPLQMDRFTKLQEIMRMASEAINDVEAMNLILQNGAGDAQTLLEKHDDMAIDIHDMMTKAQLVPIDSMIGRFRKTVSQACRAVGKQARLEMSGDGKMDRQALEKSAGAIDHILRNAVAHGIESVEDRLLKGKAEEGVILISAKMNGDEAIIEIIDDGAGVNLMKVRAKAESNGLISSQEVVSDIDVINMIFSSGFSTAEAISEVAGRGVGLDAVKKDIEGLGGSVLVENSADGNGSKFSIRVRSTIATIHVLPIRENDFWYAIPASSINRVASGKVSEDRLSVMVDEKSYVLSSVIGAVANVPESLAQINCILIKDSNVAVYVENMHQGRELVMKKLGKQATSLPGVIGASVMDDGHTALIVNPAKIISLTNIRQAKDTKKNKENRKKILVVDDSLTVRKVASRFLEREGFIVEVAIDGEDAMSKLLNFNPDILLSDIEMPRMDGFELVKLIRAEVSAIKDIPIIMISSRAIEKHIEFALSIGASAYFGKPYKEQELLHKIKQLLHIEVKVAA